MSGGAVSTRRPPAGRPWVTDGAIALVLTAVSLPSLWLLEAGAPPVADYAGASAPAIGVVLAANLPLALRRRAPVAVLAVVAAATAVGSVLPVPLVGLGLLLALYTVAAYLPRTHAIGALAALMLLMVVSLHATGQLQYLALNVILFGAVTLFGDWQRLQRARAVELVRRGEELERAQQERARLAVGHERQRIASELRDVLAHAVTAMITQAQAADRLMDREDRLAVTALETVERTGRSALVELRRLVSLLRRDESGPVPHGGADADAASGAPGPGPRAATGAVASGAVGDVGRDQAPAAVTATGRAGIRGWLRRLRRRVAGVPVLAKDGAVAVGVLVVEVATLAVISGDDVIADAQVDTDLGARAILLLVALCAPLVLRRRCPRLVLLATVAGGVLVMTLGVPAQLLAVLVALYTVAAHASRRESLPWLALLIVVAAGAMAVEGTLGFFPGTALVVAAAWLLGDRQRVSRAYRQELEVRAAGLELARRREVALALAAERSRIARELHDVVAHGIGVMMVQAGGARRTLPRDPARAAEAVRQILDCGHESLRWLRETVAVLGDEPGGRAPQPGLGDLPFLLEDFGAAGLRIELVEEGRPRERSSGVELSAYRIVQEALTNVLKHAGTDAARVRLVHGDVLVVEVCDDGAGPRDGILADTGGGHGVVGMRERARLVGGTLEVGARPGGGFRVLARLPAATAPTEADVESTLVSS